MANRVLLSLVTEKLLITITVDTRSTDGVLKKEILMRQNNLLMWKFNQSLDCLLFFAQRVDELLFHHTTDTYRYSALSLRGLAAEYCTVYRDVKNGLIDKKNLNHIIDELSNRLENDFIAKEILTEEFVSRFLKSYGAWDARTQYENIQYIGRKLSNRVYYNRIVDKLKELIAENRRKKEIDEKASLFIRELLDCGYNENYVYQMLHEVFFHREVSSLGSLDDFFNSFDFSMKNYDVYIGYSNDMSSLLPLFEKLEASDLKVSMIDFSAVPTGIKTKRQKTILKFELIKSYDMYSAFEIANLISSCVANSYSFFRHDPYSVRTYGQVVDEQKKITTIRPKKLLKYRVSALSRDDSTKNAEALIKVLFANYDNLASFTKVTTNHNSAIYSENISESLLSLWSILESIVETDSNNVEDSKIDNSTKKERSKIGNVISYTIPYLKSTYIQKLVQTCMSDIIRWDNDFFLEHIASNGFGNNDLEHMFAFLAFESTQSARNILYSRTETFPLLKYRVCSLSEQLHSSKKIKAIISAHTKRVEWHLHRIYRARNYIIHDANANESLNQELVINLHSYVDTVFSEVIVYINNSPYNDSINNAITGHKLAVSIMDEKLKNRETEKISVENALQYLYYDFEK